MNLESETSKKLSKNESIKEESRYLRGTILEGLADSSTGAITADDAQLTKFSQLSRQGFVYHRSQIYQHYV